MRGDFYHACLLILSDADISSDQHLFYTISLLVRTLLVGKKYHIEIMEMGASLTHKHYSDVIMGMVASQITSLMILYSTIYSGADQRKHQSSVSLAFVRGIHRWLVNSPHKGPVAQKMFPFDEIIMINHYTGSQNSMKFPPNDKPELQADHAKVHILEETTL